MWKLQLKKFKFNFLSIPFPPVFLIYILEMNVKVLGWIY